MLGSLRGSLGTYDLIQNLCLKNTRAIFSLFWCYQKLFDLQQLHRWWERSRSTGVRTRGQDDVAAHHVQHSPDAPERYARLHRILFLTLKKYEAGHEKRYQVLEMKLSTQRYRRDVNGSEEKNGVKIFQFLGKLWRKMWILLPHFPIFFSSFSLIYKKNGEK